MPVAEKVWSHLFEKARARNSYSTSDEKEGGHGCLSYHLWLPQREHPAPSGERREQRELGTELVACSSFFRRCAGCLAESLNFVRSVRESSSAVCKPGGRVEELYTLSASSPRQEEAPVNLELVGWNLFCVGKDWTLLKYQTIHSFQDDGPSPNPHGHCSSSWHSHSPTKSQSPARGRLFLFSFHGRRGQ